MKLGTFEKGTSKKEDSFVKLVKPLLARTERFLELSDHTQHQTIRGIRSMLMHVIESPLDISDIGALQTALGYLDQALPPKNHKATDHELKEIYHNLRQSFHTHAFTESWNQ